MQTKNSNRQENSTIRLFDEDSFTSSFEGMVLSCEKTGSGKYSVVLDRTAFFPEGGGQPSDVGTISCGDEPAAEVLDVQEKDGIIFHITDMPVPCERVMGTINFRLRYERMRNHSGEHLLSGLAHRMYSCTNVGFHLSDEAVTVDFDKQLSQQQLDMLEKAVNGIIAENVKIKAYYPEAAELREMEYRSKLELTENVRIVEIGEKDRLYDRCACCAPHVAQTSEIGTLLITGNMNYKGGTRLTMVCGENAFRAAKQALSNVREISALLSSKASEAAQAVERYIEHTKEQGAKNSAVLNAYIDMRFSQLSETEGNIVLFEPDLDRNHLRKLVDRAADICGGICAGFTGSDEEGWFYIIISRTHDLKSEAKELNRKMNGRGGGSSQMIQGSASAPRKVLEEVFR